MDMPSLGLLELFDLTPAEDRPDYFRGPSQWRDVGTVYGGQSLGQAVMAASLTVDGSRPAHSMHAYFLRAGDPTEPVDYAVERIQEGRSSSRRRVQAIQDGQIILSMIASFQDDFPSPAHQSEMPTGIPGPEELPAREGNGRAHSGMEATLDIRILPDPTPLGGQEFRRMAQWMRCIEDLPDDQHFQRAALAYGSDAGLLLPALVVHDYLSDTKGLRAASLDHALWWHGPVHAQDWLLYVFETPQSGDGRGLTMGRIFAEDGRLVATVAQEGMAKLVGPA